jgi:hypothetical protein
MQVHRSWLLLRCVALPALILAVGAVVSAQQGRQARPARSSEAKRQVAKRIEREKAIALLNESSDSVSSVSDLFYKARIEAQIADAFWTSDPQRARLLFRRAWQSATESDKADLEAELNSGSVVSRDSKELSEAREEVIARTARRDPALASGFIEALQSRSSDEARTDRNPDFRSDPWGRLSVAGATRLQLANELLRDGLTENAAAIAAPVVAEGVSGGLIAFLIALRDRNAAVADPLYAQLAARALGDPGADSNSVLLLSAPLVSPRLLVVMDGQGSLQFRSVAPGAQTGAAGPPVPQALRNSIYSAASSILLRQALPSPEQNGSQVAAASYFTISRLLPFFDQEAAHLAPGLRARLEILALGIDSNRLENLSSRSAVRTVTSGSAGDPLRPQQDELAHARDPATRDRIATRLVIAAVRNKFWDRARRVAAEISDSSLQRSALTLISLNEIADIAHAYRDKREDDYETVVAYLNKANVPPLALAWGYAQAASIAGRKPGSSRPLELIREAARFAFETSPGTRERVAAFGVVSIAAASVAKKEAWEYVREVVRAANSTEDYLGDEEVLDLAPSSGERADLALTIDANPFRVDRLFAVMAGQDFDEALVQARGLDAPIPRLLSFVAIARNKLSAER